MKRRGTIDSILQDLHLDTARYLQELRRLSIQSSYSHRLERQEEQSVEPSELLTSSRVSPKLHAVYDNTTEGKPLATDRDGNIITIGDRVTFLTKGKFKSTEGTITKFSKLNERVFATDSNGQEIPRAPRNVRIIGVPQRHLTQP